MKTVKRIQIQGQNGNIGDSAYKFVNQVLKRRYGNGVTFALAEEAEDVMNQIKEAGFDCCLDGYEWQIMEPNDYEVGNIITQVNDFAMKVKLKVLEIKDDVKHGKIAKVKYADRPRKHSFWIKAQTRERFLEEVKDALCKYTSGFDVESLV